MKKLDLYIIRQFLSTLSMTLMGFVSVILVVDLIENLDRFIDNSIPAGITFTYYIYDNIQYVFLQNILSEIVLYDIYHKLKLFLLYFYWFPESVT